MFDIKNTLFVYINLDHRQDRKNYMEYLLSSMNLHYVRFSAIKPTKDALLNGYFKPFYERAVFWLQDFLKSDDHDQNRLSIGTFGCYLSHFMVLKKYSRKYSSIVILEDDVKFSIYSLKKFIRMTKKLEPLDVDILRPTYGDGYKNNDSFLNNITSSIYEFNSPFKHSKYVENDINHEYFGSTHFVYYHNISRVIDFLESENVFNIDAIYSTNHLKSFIVASKNIYQDRQQFVSDITSFSSLKS